MISFIMMAKNVEKFIGEAIESLQKEEIVRWELILVDDHSDDRTFDVAKKYAKEDRRIKLVRNKYNGKVRGTNYGYTLAQGDIIKCIDSDDVLLPEYFRHYNDLMQYDTHGHSAYIVDQDLKKMAIYHANSKIFTEDFNYVLSNMISIPKSFWSIRRNIAEKIFPMPDDLPFEDVWISLSVKKYSKSIFNLKEPLYLYRQHNNQTFGGIINYEKSLVTFRAKRMLKLIEAIKKDATLIDKSNLYLLKKSEYYNRFLSMEKLPLLKVTVSDMSLFMKLKVVLIKHYPLVAKKINVLKWKYDNIVG